MTVGRAGFGTVSKETRARKLDRFVEIDGCEVQAWADAGKVSDIMWTQLLLSRRDEA